MKKRYIDTEVKRQIEQRLLKARDNLQNAVQWAAQLTGAGHIEQLPNEVRVTLYKLFSEVALANTGVRYYLGYADVLFEKKED